MVVEGRTNCLRSVGVDAGVKGWIQQSKTSMPGIWAWDVAPELNFRQSPISHFPSPPLSFTLSLHLLLNMQNTFHRGILPAVGVGLRVALCLTLTESQGQERGDCFSGWLSSLHRARARVRGSSSRSHKRTRDLNRHFTEKADGCPQTHCSESSVVGTMQTNSALTSHSTPTGTVTTGEIDGGKCRQTCAAP